MNENTTIFISHATHEDDYFAIWLCVRLRALGYDAWVDQEELKVGDSFATIIQPIIQKKSIRFIAINSEHYVRKYKDQNSGVSKELNCAANVKDIDRFITPIRIDDVAYEDFPYHYNGWNAIDFKENWQKGLVELVTHYEKDKVPKSRLPLNVEKRWFKSLVGSKNVLNVNEQYYSNWVGFQLPKGFYVSEPEIFQEESIYLIPYPKIMEGKRLLTFADKSDLEKYIKISSIIFLETDKLLSMKEININNDFILKEPQKKLIRLLNNSFECHLQEHNLIAFRNAKRNRPIFYFRHDENTSKIINLKAFNRRGRSLTGKSIEKVNGKRKRIHWHYAFKANASIDPCPHFQIISSIIITDENFIRLEALQANSVRKSLTVDWYNRKWFETLLASLWYISNKKEKPLIELNVANDSALKLDVLPLNATSEIGYIEPENDQTN